MGSAKNSAACRDAVIGQVSSVGQLAMNVGTLGTSSAASTGANAAKNAGKIAGLKKKLDQLRKSVKANKDFQKVAKAAKKAK